MSCSAKLGQGVLGVWAAAALVSCGGTTFEPASALELRATVVDSQSATDGKLVVAVQFYQQGELVQVGGDVVVSCNDQKLEWNGLAYGARLNPAAVGQSLAVAHERQGVRTRALIQVPPRPVITSPVAGAQVQRAQTLQVLYQAGSGTSVQVSVAGPAASRQSAEQPDNGTASVEALAVGAGVGTITLVRKVEGVVAGTGFASARYTYTIDAQQAVTWQ